VKKIRSRSSYGEQHGSSNFDPWYYWMIVILVHQQYNDVLAIHHPDYYEALMPYKTELMTSMQVILVRIHPDP